MKTLLVLALALTAVIAEEEKKPELKVVTPYLYNNLYHHPLTYASNYHHYPLTYAANYHYPVVQTQYVPKEYEVEVKKVEYVQKATGCKNVFGFDVPCNNDHEVEKRSADDEEEKPELKVVTPYLYNNLYHAPLAYNNYYHAPLAYHAPVVYHTPAGCRNNQGALVPCHIAKRSADEEEMKPEEEKKVAPLTYVHPYTAYPFHYNYAPLTYTAPVKVEVEEPKVEKVEVQAPTVYTHPLVYTHQVAHHAPVTYTHPIATPVTYTQKVEVPTPKFKEVVQQVQIGANCYNHLGFAVPCQDN